MGFLAAGNIIVVYKYTTPIYIYDYPYSGTMKTTLAEYVMQKGLAQGAYGIITLRRYSRAEPTNKEMAMNRMRECLLRGTPFHFIGLWGGAKTSKTGRADSADKNSLDFICSVREAIGKAGIKSDFSILFCDAHQQIANGVESRASEDYFASLLPLAGEREVGILRLVQLVGDSSIDNYSSTLARIAAQKIMEDSEVKERVINTAKKHSSHKGLPRYEIALVYLETEIFFLSKLDAHFSNMPLFFAFSDPAVQKPIALAAGVPMFHFNAKLDSGVHDCPWYAQGD